MEPFFDSENGGVMGKMTPEKAVDLLRKKGMDVSVEEAILVLAFLRMLADMIVSSHLEQVAKMQEREISDRAA